MFLKTLKINKNNNGNKPNQQSKSATLTTSLPSSQQLPLGLKKYREDNLTGNRQKG